MVKGCHRFVSFGLFVMIAGTFNRMYASEQMSGEFPNAVEDYVRVKNEASPSRVIYKGVTLPQEGVFRDVIIDFEAVQCSSASSAVYVDTFLYDLGWDLKDLMKSSNFTGKALIENNLLARRLIAAASIVRGYNDDFRSSVTRDLSSLSPIIDQVLEQIKSSKDQF